MIIASIDIGSNTVLLLIAEVYPGEGKIIPLRDKQRIPRISEGLTKGGRISDQAVSRLMDVLKEYFGIIRDYNCERILISGTSAFRKAGNGEAVKSLIRKAFKTEMNILGGNEEAELAFLGTRSYGSPGTNRLVIDVGGGSTEIIYGNDKNILFSKSFDIGVVSLSEKYLNKFEPGESGRSNLYAYIKKVFLMLPGHNIVPVKTIALAGTPVTLACIRKGIQEYDESKVEGLILTKQDIEDLLIHIAGFSPSELLAKFPGIVKGREDLILSGTSILLVLCDILNLSEILVSTKGIRYGAIEKLLTGNS